MVKVQCGGDGVFFHINGDDAAENVGSADQSVFRGTRLKNHRRTRAVCGKGDSVDIVAVPAFESADSAMFFAGVDQKSIHSTERHDAPRCCSMR